jgi:THO complex subunit 2
VEDGEVKDAKDGKSQSASNASTLPATAVQKEGLPPKPGSQKDASKVDLPSALGKIDSSGTGSNKPPTPKPIAAIPATNSSARLDPPKSSSSNSNTDRSGHSLPNRPDVPIPGRVSHDRFGQVRIHEGRDAREPRARESRDHREEREVAEAPRREHRGPRESGEFKPSEPGPRLERPRDVSSSDRRPPEGLARDSGRAPENDWPSRSEQGPRRGDHATHERDSRQSRDRGLGSGRGHESGGRSREPTREPGQPGAPPAPPANLDTQGPPMNPERAALFQKERQPRTDRPPERSSDRQPRAHEPDRNDFVNPERAAMINDGRPGPSRPPRDEGRDRNMPRNSSPRRGDRFGSDIGPDGPRDDRHGGRSQQSDHRSSLRDSHGPSSQTNNSRDRNPDRDGDRGFAGEKDRDSFHGPPSRDQESSRPSYQDHNYGRLNQIQSVTDVPPSGPRGPGRGRGGGSGGGARGGSMNANSSRPDSRYSNNDTPRAPTPEKHPPTGPASGRGRRGQYDHGSAALNSPTISTPTNNHQDRMRHPAPPMSSPAQQSHTSSQAPPNIHPDRFAQVNQSPAPGGPSGGHGPHTRSSLPAANTPDRPTGPGGSRQATGNFSGTPTTDLAPPTGPSGNDRSRSGGSRRQIAGVNNILQQAQANISDNSRSSSLRRGGGSRTNLANSDAQVLTGGSPVGTPTHERQDPIRPDAPTERMGANGDDYSNRGDHDRTRRDRERHDRSGRPSRRSSRERERSPEREPREQREYRDRRSGATSGQGAPNRDDREPLRRSMRETPSGNREGNISGGPNNSNSGRESRHREGTSGAGRSEDWGGSMRGGHRGGHRDGGSRQGGEDRRDARGDDRGRKRRSEEGLGGMTNEREKRQRR